MHGTVDKLIQLIAANKTRKKQLGTVRLRVCVRNKEKVCLFYVVPDMCHPIFSLPDLTNMKLLSFDILLKSDLKANSSVDSNLMKQSIPANYHNVFSGLGKLKVDPVKINLREDAIALQRPCSHVPIAIRKKFQEELDNLVKKGVPTKLDNKKPRSCFLFWCILNVVVIFYYIFINVQLLWLLHDIILHII